MAKKIGDGENTQGSTAGVNFDQVIYNAMTEDGVLTSMQIGFAIAQCRLESDNYTSNLFRNYNNLNGYKFVEPNGSSWQSGRGPLSPEGDYYGAYDSVENSAHELSFWWQRRAAAGFDLTSLVDIPSYAAALKSFGWYGSAEFAYAQRMQAVSLLIDIQNSTGISTGGIDPTLILVGLIAGTVFISKII